MRGIEKLINGEFLTKESVIDKHKGLVHRECKKLRTYAKRQGFEYEDIASLGFIGLLKAFEKFDSEKFDVRFSTYAVPMIWGEIQRTLRNSNAGLHYGRPTKELAWQIRRLEMDELPLEAIAEQLEIAEEKVSHALHFLSYGSPSSLDKPLQLNDGEASISELIGSPDDLTAVYVEEFIASLKPEQRTIVELTVAGEKQADIADVIGKSQVHVSRSLRKIGNQYLAFSRLESNVLSVPREHKVKPVKDVNPLVENKRNLSKEMVEELRAQGLTWQAIADKLRISLPALNTRRQNWELEKIRTQQETPAVEAVREKEDPQETLHAEISMLKESMREKDEIINSLHYKIGEINQQKERVPQLEDQVRTLSVDLHDERKLLRLLLERETGRLKRFAEPVLH